MELTVVPGAGARPADPASEPPEAAVTWWDVLPGDDPPRSIDPEILAELAHATLVPSCSAIHDGLAMIVHSLDESGHLLQLGILARSRDVTTVHVAFNEAVTKESLAKETAAVAARLVDRHEDIATGHDLAALILMELTTTLRTLLEKAAAHSGRLDRRVRDEKIRNQEAFLHELFEVRRDLFTVRNRLAQTLEVAQAAARYDPQAYEEIVDTLERLLRMCDGERDFFSGVIDYFEQRVNVKINFASERLALIAAVVLPLSAVSGILGMNTIVTEETNIVVTILLMALMAGMAIALLVWAKKKDWW